MCSAVCAGCLRREEAENRNERGFVTMVESSLRDVLRAIEQDENGNMPLPIVTTPTEEQKHSVAPQMLVVSRLGDVADANAPDEWDDFDAEPVSSWWSNRIGFGTFAVAAVGASFLAPVAVMMLAGSIVIAPLPSGEWTVASLDDIQFEKHGVGAAKEAEKPTEIRQAGFPRIQEFAGLWHSLTAEPPAPRLSTKLSVEANPGETVALPIHIENAGGLSPSAALIVRGVPEFASLSAAEPQTDGAWRVPLSAAGDLTLTAYARPARDQELVMELVTPEGSVMARASTVLKAGPEPVAEVAAVATMPPPAITASLPVKKETPALQPDNRPSAAATPEVPVRPAAKTAAATPTEARREPAKPKARVSASAPMKAGLAGVPPQPGSTTVKKPRTPRVVIVDELPDTAGPLLPFLSASPEPVVQPSPQSAATSTSVWKEPWARAAFQPD